MRPKSAFSLVVSGSHQRPRHQRSRTFRGTRLLRSNICPAQVEASALKEPRARQGSVRGDFLRNVLPGRLEPPRRVVVSPWSAWTGDDCERRPVKRSLRLAWVRGTRRTRPTTQRGREHNRATSAVPRSKQQSATFVQRQPNRGRDSESDEIRDQRNLGRDLHFHQSAAAAHSSPNTSQCGSTPVISATALICCIEGSHLPCSQSLTLAWVRPTSAPNAFWLYRATLRACLIL